MEANLRQWLIVAGVVALLALLLRLPGLGSFMTVDEENWMFRSAAFWDKLAVGDLGGTFMTSHPGATTMWLAGAGIALQEIRLGEPLDHDMLAQFRLPALLPLVLAVSLGIGLVAGWLARLESPLVGAAIGGFLAADPYLVGMSQVVHLDALLAISMLLAITAGWGWLQTRQWSWLIAASVCVGVALATKLLLALWVVACVGIAALVKEWYQEQRQWRSLGYGLGIGILLSFGVFALLWPAVLTKADLQVGGIVEDTQVIVADEHVALETGEDAIESWTFYIRTLVSRTVPLHLLLVVGAAVLWMRLSRDQKKRTFFGWLFLYGVGYAVAITLAAKKADRYLLPMLVLLPVFSGWAFASVLPRVAALLRRQSAVWVLLAGAILLLSGLTLSLTPYAIAYTGVVDVRPLSQQGWGEGLEAAATWLNNRTAAAEVYVASWYPGVTSTYFDGRTMSLSSRHDARVGYVVLYRNMAGRGPEDPATDILAEWEDVEPVHTVFVQGRPYAWIYEQLGLYYFPSHVGEITTGVTVGQTVPVSHDGWQAIDVGFATFSSRENTQEVVLEIREDPKAAEALRTARVPAQEIADQSWQRFSFAPILDSAGKTYFISLASPTSVPGDAVTVRFSPVDVRPGTFFLQRRPPQENEEWADFERAEADMAYRLPLASSRPSSVE